MTPDERAEIDDVRQEVAALRSRLAIYERVIHALHAAIVETGHLPFDVADILANETRGRDGKADAATAAAQVRADRLDKALSEVTRLMSDSHDDT